MPRVSDLAGHPDLNGPQNPEFHKRSRCAPNPAVSALANHHGAFPLMPPHLIQTSLRVYSRPAAGVAYQEESGTSIYLRDPDGALLELIAGPLGEMYGAKVL